MVGFVFNWLGLIGLVGFGFNWFYWFGWVLIDSIGSIGLVEFLIDPIGWVWLIGLALIGWRRWGRG
jgi:hypothetical protein